MSWKRYLGVEPVMFLYMLAIMLTSVVEESFYIHKVCTVNYGLSLNVCNHLDLPQNKQYKQDIQVSVSTFYQWYNIVSQGIPVVLSLFLGAWSDRVGRKIPLLLGLVANLFFAVMFVVNCLMETWRLEMILWTACLPCALGGGNLTVFMAAFSYLADTTSEANRTLRTTFLEVAYLLPMPIGVAIGSKLFHLLEEDYARLFTVKACLLLLALVYSLVFLERRTAEPGGSRLTGCWCGLLNWSYMVDSLWTLLRARPGRGRSMLLLVIGAMALYTFQRDESHMMYLYTMLEFDWGVDEFSTFRTVQSALYNIGLLFGVPIMVKLLKITDTVVIIIGSVCHISGRIVYILVRNGMLLYIGAVLATLGPVVAPVLRSLTSKLVPSSERGKAFAALSVADSCAPLLSGVVYSQVYNSSQASFPQAFFLVTCASQLLVLTIAGYITYLLQGQNLSQAHDEENVGSTTSLNRSQDS